MAGFGVYLLRRIINVSFENIFLLFLITALTMFGCSSDEQKKVAHYEKGLAYFDNGEFKSARLEFKNAIQIDSKYVAAYQKLGEANLKIGDAQGAFRAYSNLTELEPENTAAQLKLATFLMLAKKFEESRKKLDMVLNREPTNIDALLMLAGMLGRRKIFPNLKPPLKKCWRLTARRPGLFGSGVSVDPPREGSLKPSKLYKKR